LHEDSLLCIGDQARMMILLSPRLTIHDKIKNCITIVDWPLPTDAQIDQSIAMIWETYAANNNLPPIAPQEREEVVENLRGLTVNEVDNILAMVVQANRGFGPAGMRMLCEEKARSLKKGEILTSITNVTDPSEIGGFGNVLEFVADRKDAYTREARAQKIDLPRGIALWGVPGTGKSLVARAICNLLGKPGLRMDIGAIFAGLVGESEARMRQTLKQVSAHRGCVLFVDEIDKAFANVGRSTGDSGVGQRILGQFLTWLEEHKDAAFTIVTANRLDVLPPELLRAGRFDAIFYTDLPTAKEREQILRIHLRKRDVDPDKLPTGVKTMMGRDEWDALIADTTDFVGAELERVVCDARYKSFKNRRHGVPTFDELIMAARATVPMAVRDADEIQKIREACAGRAIPASIQDTVSGGLRQVN
jgi:MoxR-like ATPase